MNQEIYSCIAAKFISTNASKTSLFIQRFQANNYGACFSKYNGYEYERFPGILSEQNSV